MARSDQDQMNPEHGTAPEERAPSIREDRKAKRGDLEEMKQRGTLTPESRKQGVTSHLPESETEYMYRSEDAGSGKRFEKDEQG
ncbi:MAG TPA: hypothetical protein VFS41_00770 [Edaphobacter sp.]|nr:hypothetical protein [Edaphobacter sp.]